MKYALYIHGRLSRKGACSNGIARITAPEGATLRVTGGARFPEWHMMMAGKWERMPMAAPPAPTDSATDGAFGLTWDEIERKQGGKLTRPAP